MELFLREVAGWLNYTQELLVLALVLARTMPMIIQTPFLGGKLAPMEIKIGLGLLFTAVLWPIARVSITAPLPTTAVPFLLLMAKELFIGLAIGFVNSLVFALMEMAGRLVDTSRGAALAEVLEPHSGLRATPFGDLYYQLFLVMFVALGAHGIFFEAFFFSFAAIPLNVGLPPPAELASFADLTMRLTGDILLAAVLLAAPVLAVMLVTDIVFGILNRIAPQLHAYFMAMPVKAMVGIALVVAVMGALTERLRHWVLWSLSAAERTLELLVR